MEALFLSMVNRSIAAGYLVLAVLILRLLLKKAPRWINCALWLLVAVRLVWPFSIVSPMSLIPSPEPLPPEILYTAAPAIHSGINVVDQAVNPVLATSMTASPMASANPTQIWSFLLSRVWIAGVVIMLLWAVVSVLRVRRSVRASVPLRDNLMICDGLGSPFILGVFRPRVYLPSDLDDNKLAHIIAHENAHLSRRDHWWKPIGYGLLSLFWFHPLLWVAYVLLCRDIEYACDQRVIRDMEPAARKSYSTTLLECSLPRYRIAVCPLAFGEVGVKQRIRSIADYRRPAFWVVLIGILACIVAAVCFLTDPAEPADPMSMPTLTAQIHQINGDSMLVSPTDDPEEMIWVPLKNLEPSPEPVRNDYVRITYDGNIAESFPAQLNNPYHIQVVARRSSDATGYEALIDTCKTALAEQWTPEEFTAAGLSPLLVGSSLDTCGYLLIDQDCDGVNELLLGTLHDSDVSSMYTLRNGKPVPVILCDGKQAGYQFLAGNQYTHYYVTASGQSVFAVYEMEKGELVFREGVVWTEPEDENTRYFKTTDETLNPVHLVSCTVDEAKSFISHKHLYTNPNLIPFREGIHVNFQGSDMIPQLFDIIFSSPLEFSAPGDYLNAHPDEVKALLSYGDETLEYVIVQFLESNQVGLEGHLYRYFLDELAPSEAIQGNWLTGQDYFSSWFSTAMRASYNYTPEELEQRCPAYALAVKLSTDPNPPRARSYDD